MLERDGLHEVDTGALTSAYSVSTADGVLWSVSVDSFDGKTRSHYD